MPNLVLTNRCNRSCPYCFAQSAMAASTAEELDFSEIIKVADLISASGPPQISLLGGEPTLHSRFLEIVEYLLERDLQILVFTNGMCTQEKIDGLRRLSRGTRLRFVVNVNHPKIDDTMLKQERFLAVLHDLCDLGSNIYLPEENFAYLGDLARRTGITNASIRLGLAQPAVDMTNGHLRPELYRSISQHIVELAEDVLPLRLRLSFDCGFPLCMFSDEELGRLRRCAADTKFYCQTAIDFGTQNRVWSCYPLAGLTKVSYERTSTLNEIADRFTERNQELRSSVPWRGIFRACGDCRHLDLGICGGGCLAHALTQHEQQTTC